MLKHEQRRTGGDEGHGTRGSDGVVLRRGGLQGRAESGAVGLRETGEHSLSCGGSMEEVGGWMDLDREDEAGDWLAGDPEGKTKRRQGGGFCGGGEEIIDGSASLGFGLL